MGRSDCQEKKKCEDKYLIKSIPCTIYKPGHYCLGKDFDWNYPEKIAINIISDNVVLDFNQRKIKTSVSSDADFPLVVVESAKNVTLNNVHLEAINEAVNTSPGLHIKNSENVDVNDPILINLGGANSSDLTKTSVGFVVDRSNYVNVSKLYIKNDNFPAGALDNSLMFFRSKNISLLDSETQFSSSLVLNCCNVEILRTTFDNSQENNVKQPLTVIDSSFDTNITENIIVSDCIVKSRNSSCIFITNFPERKMSNVLIENNTIYCDSNEVTFRRGIFVNNGVTACTIRNNNIVNSGPSSTGILVRWSSNNTIEKNKVYSKNEAAGAFQVDGSLNQPANNNVFKNNTAIGDDPNLSNFIGFVAASFPAGFAKYNNFVKNTAGGFRVGFTDNSVSVTDYAECTIFSKNVINGNGTNLIHDPNPPVNSLSEGNVINCEVPLVVLSQKVSSGNNEESVKNEKESPEYFFSDK